MNILAIGAHPDDIEMQCAGTLALYRQQGHSIFFAVATNGNVGSPVLTREEIADIRHKEQLKACELIGAELIWMGYEDEWLFNDRATRTRFIDAIRQAKPDIIFAHGPTDYHPDHRAVAQLSEDARIPSSIRLVETSLPHLDRIPHMFFMDNVAGIGFEPEAYVDISPVIELKREMLLCHKSQNDWMRALFEDCSITDLMDKNAAQRGAASGVNYAEAFREVKTFPQNGTYSMLPQK
ncbi:MAG: PIG-L deacetylase family protein [Roseibium album]|uniref:PIG-L deacetylase family protein n=1 Tax=Roseibium album TaxID=311410 RepID=UPI0032ECF9D6